MTNPDREQIRRRAAMAGGLLFAALFVVAGVWWLDNSMAEYRAAKEAKEAAAEAAEKEVHEKRMQSERQAREAIAESKRRLEESRRK